MRIGFVVTPLLLASTVYAAPTSVTIAGTHQVAAGCGMIWDPACTNTDLAYEEASDAWKGSVTLPAGNYNYKAAIDHAWTINYGARATESGDEIVFVLGEQRTVKFRYDDKSHWVMSNADHALVTAAGSFQSELGCPGDWAPDCLRSWLQDTTNSGIYRATFTLPEGAYETKIAINENWDENYGAEGMPGGGNIAFTIGPSGSARFAYDSATHVLTVDTSPPDLAPADDLATQPDLSVVADLGVSDDLAAPNNDDLASSTNNDLTTSANDLAPARDLSGASPPDFSSTRDLANGTMSANKGGCSVANDGAADAALGGIFASLLYCALVRSGSRRSSSRALARR